MATALVETAADRPLALAMRADLEFCEQTFGGRRFWAVKDPVALNYFHLREEEYQLLRMLDGRASLEDVRRGASAQFAPRRFSHEQVQGFLATLHRHGLLLSTAPGQGLELVERRQRARRRRWLEGLLGVLAIRLRGVRPGALLDGLAAACGWLFSPLAVCVVAALATTALALVAVEFGAVRARLPEMDTIIGAANLPWLVLVLAATKVLHELGHAVACRRLGGDCHEIGLMFLVFTPCLYCNVSDSWMMRDKWRRIGVAAAGIYVELLLAAVCTLLWWFSQPGLFNALCLNVMLVCSLGTLLFNGNPLLRYDGYFILADLVEVPNLKAQSSAVVRDWLARWCLGIDAGEDRGRPPGRRALLALYAVASEIYRIVIVVLVLWALAAVAKTHRLDVLVLPVAAITFAGMTWPAVERAARLARDPARRRRLAPARVALSGLLLAAAVAASLYVPLPRRVSAPAMLDYRDAARVYATQRGTLKSAARAGQAVAAGDVLARLENRHIDLEIARLRGSRDTQRRLLESLEARRLDGTVDSGPIPAARAALADAQQRLDQLERDAAGLTITAPRDGTVLPPPAVHDTNAAGQLPRFGGTPLDERNLGATLETGTLVCLVGDPRRFEAIVHLGEDDVELVRVGALAEIAPDHQPGRSYTGRVVEVARLDLDVMPRELAAAGDVPSRTDPQGRARPLDTWYQARVQFDDPPQNLVARAHGRAKIDAAGQTLAARLARFLRQTFSR